MESVIRHLGCVANFSTFLQNKLITSQINSLYKFPKFIRPFISALPEKGLKDIHSFKMSPRGIYRCVANRMLLAGLRLRGLRVSLMVRDLGTLFAQNAITALERSLFCFKMFEIFTKKWLQSN
jgi:hypothetical protein